MSREFSAFIRRALVSVHDKTGVVDFARALSAEFGVEILSTGGTAGLLLEHKVPFTPVEQVTGFAEMLGGRVKTLHPRIHSAILADREDPDHLRQLREQGIEPIDMVVVNLYPFERAVADPNCTHANAMEMIDIGGPCMLRAAAKNHRHVLPVFEPAQYDEILSEMRRAKHDGGVSAELRIRLASAAFETTARYDAHVAHWLSKQAPIRNEPAVDVSSAPPTARLRYGENPHQGAEVHHRGVECPAHDLFKAAARWQNWDALSFNNLVDADSALALIGDLTFCLPAGLLVASAKPPTMDFACVFVKHTNPCGVGVAKDAMEAYPRAYRGDVNAAMGGVLACSFPVDADFAVAVMESFERWGRPMGAGGFFVEVWLAPTFAADAVEVIRRRKEWGARSRLLEVGPVGSSPDPVATELKSIAGGLLVQQRDLPALNEDDWRVVTTRPPTVAEMADLRLAWLIAKHTKSNAISICRDGMLLGNGAGQMARVMSCRLATWLARENGHDTKLKGAAAASDAFFPFADGPRILMDTGITALIQPGGSKRDAETIDACNERGAAMVFTSTRHFRH